MTWLRTPIVLLAVLALAAPLHAGEPDPVAATEAFVDALSRADLPALLDCLADDATLFGPSPDTPKRIEGREAIAALLEPMFKRLRERGEGPVYMNLVPRDLHAQLMDDAAIVTFHLGQLPDEPLPQDYSFSRRTFVLRRIDGRWKIVHLHASSVIIPAEIETLE